MSDMNAGKGGGGKVNGLGIANAILGGITGVGNFISDIATRQQQERLQREAWSREDNAIQRRAADLKAAGLSQTLAAGSAASSQAPIRLDAPKLNVDPIGGYLKAEAQQAQIKAAELGFAQQRADIARTEAQTDYIIQQKENLKQDYEFQFMDDPEKIRERQLRNAFADQTMQLKIDALKSKLTTEELHQANIEMDTILKKSGADLNYVKEWTEKAWTAYATAKTAREVQEGINDVADRNRKYAEGGEYEMELDRLAIDLQIKQRIWENMKKDAKTPYQWEGLGKEIPKALKWVF